MRIAGMPPLARRRFLACARVAVSGLCDTAHDQARAMANAAADQTDALVGPLYKLNSQHLILEIDISWF